MAKKECRQSFACDLWILDSISKIPNFLRFPILPVHNRVNFSLLSKFKSCFVKTHGHKNLITFHPTIALSICTWFLKNRIKFDFWKIKFEKSSLTNWIFNLQKLISKLSFSGYTGSKNTIRNRLKILFVEHDFKFLNWRIAKIRCR